RAPGRTAVGLRLLEPKRKGLARRNRAAPLSFRSTKPTGTCRHVMVKVSPDTTGQEAFRRHSPRCHAARHAGPAQVRGSALDRGGAEAGAQAGVKPEPHRCE